MRIGLMIGPEQGHRPDKVARLVADAQAAEAAGFGSIWVPQVPNDFDALTAIALMGAATQRVEIGTAVMPIQTRHPIAMAQQALSNQAVCEGRFTLETALRSSLIDEPTPVLLLGAAWRPGTLS